MSHTVPLPEGRVELICDTTRPSGKGIFYGFNSKYAEFTLPDVYTGSLPDLPGLLL